MQNGWLGSAWLALGLDALVFWNAARVWPLDPEAPEPEPDPDPEAAAGPPWDPLGITIFI